MSNVVTLKAGASIAPIIPQTIEEVFRLSNGIAASGLAAKGMDKPEQITVAILTGMEIGLPPMFAIQKIAVVNGRPTIWGDAVPALLWARGFKLREWTEGDVAHCEVTRPDGEKIVRSFSDADAKAAGLLGKAGPWTQYRPRMRQMRARGYACRDGAADALSGLYLREEIDEPMRDITPAPERIAAPAIDDIPDAPEPASARAAPSVDAEPDDPIADPDSVIAKIQDDLALCSSVEEVGEVAEQYADLLPRLPKEHRAQAAKLIAEAAE
jgi:hypothetical protein